MGTDAIASLELFRGFPYFVTRLSPAFYHFILLPSNLDASVIYNFALRQQAANRLQSCLVLSDKACIYGNNGLDVSISEHPPRGGSVATGGLRPAMQFAVSPEMTQRQIQLREFAARLNSGGGYLMGDLAKGGYIASPEELERLGGVQANGVPRGLELCVSCGMWRGECLDPSPQFRGQVMNVLCHCDNHNRCAGCGGLLYEYRLNANYYNPSDGCIWHVPGFCSLNHRCR